MSAGYEILPWSFSRLTDYERCAFYAYQVHVKKNKGAQSQYAARGELLHLSASNYAMGTDKKLHRELVNYRRQLKNLRDDRIKISLTSEQKVGLNVRWQPVEFFRGPGLWCRLVEDLKWLQEDEVHVRDFKTGKKYAEHEDQLQLYAAAELARHPEVKTAVVADWYVDYPDLETEMTYTQADGRKLRKGFEARVVKMAKDTKLLPVANSKCKWCHLNRNNGGTCDVGAKG